MVNIRSALTPDVQLPSPVSYKSPRTRLSPLAASFSIPTVSRNGFVDYYELLSVDDTASKEEIKTAYRTMAKYCHPDRNADGHELCIMLNEAYETLSDAVRRAAYDTDLLKWLTDEDDGYTGRAYSRWVPYGHRLSKAPSSSEKRAVFVDEIACIGCKQCIYIAAATFRIEPEFGRSRVYAQWADTEDNIKAAMESCPVSCIHWVQREELPALEHVTRNVCERVNVGMMMSGQGGYMDDPFTASAKFLREREDREQRRRQESRFSRAQQEARDRAAAVIRQEQFGWLGEMLLGGLMASSGPVAASDGEQPRAETELTRRRRARRDKVVANAAESSLGSMDDDLYGSLASYEDVGSSIDDLMASHDEWGTVAKDQAMVPRKVYVAAAAREREREKEKAISSVEPANIKMGA